MKKINLYYEHINIDKNDPLQSIKSSEIFKTDFNSMKPSYDNLTQEFFNKELEDVRWHAKEFDISFNEIIQFLEKECEGTVLYIKDDINNYSIGFLENEEKATEAAYKFCQKIIQSMIENDDDNIFVNMEDDEAFAAGFFKIL